MTEGLGQERRASTATPIWGDGSYQGGAFGRGGEGAGLKFSIKSVELGVCGCLSAAAAGPFKLELREGVWVGDRDFGGIWTLRREISGEQRVRNTAFGAGQSGRRKTEDSELTEGP